MKKAFVTGITGQDGSYLAEFLLYKGYEVHGLIRRASTFNTHRISHLFQDPHVAQSRLHLHYGELTDSSRISALLSEIRPDEVYHLAAQSHVRVSFDEPVNTGNLTGLATTRLLEAIRLWSPGSRYYQASSSEMFGASAPPQNENTAFHPRSPYGVAKVYSYWITKNYREAYGLFASNGILFNHESPRRGETFVTRKITRAAAQIKLGLQEKLFLGNLAAIRDWGYAPEYVVAMWKMMQLSAPQDLVIATGTAETVEGFMNSVFFEAGLSPEEHVVIDSRYFRPTEVESLIGDSERAQNLINWQAKVLPRDLAKIMFDFDLAHARGERQIDFIDWSNLI